MNDKQAEEFCELYNRLLDFDQTLAKEQDALRERLAHVRRTRREAARQMKQLNLLLER